MRQLGIVAVAATMALAAIAGCGTATSTATDDSTAAADATSSRRARTLAAARRGFRTNLVSDDESYGPPEEPPADSAFQLVRYESPAGRLAAYLTKDPGDGVRHPAIVWITGGDCNTIGDVWTPRPRDNDQSARPFSEAGIVVMFPSQRGGNDNPGRREGFMGEVVDILAATEYLRKLPYVDPERIYLGGHSTGGTMAMLVGECTDRYRAIFALGPVAAVAQYGGSYIYCDPNDDRELRLRSPIYWLDSVRSPMYVFEGVDRGNWDSIEYMVEANRNPQIHFFPVPGHDHFSVIAPLAEALAAQIVADSIQIDEAMVARLR